MKEKRGNITSVALVGSLVLILILVIGTVWMGNSARRDTDRAVRTVSTLYLNELAGRREQVVESNLEERINELRIAIDLMTDEDLSDKEHMEAYQVRIKSLFNLDKFAFVDEDGMIYTSTGMQDNIADYAFDYRTISEPEISVMNLREPEKQVIIALPVRMELPFSGQMLKACFAAVDMGRMLAGTSMEAQADSPTFCNIYTDSGVALSNTILGGLAMEDNLLEAMQHAVMDKGFSYEQFIEDFSARRQGQVSFTYDGIHETLSFVPVGGTNWLLTYLIRESVITEEVGAISEGIIRRSVIQSAATVIVLLGMFTFILAQIRRNALLTLEKETTDAANRAKREELEQRLRLQDELLAQKEQQKEQNRLITALASDYWSVYYLDLDQDSGVCYQAHEDVENGFRVGDRFRYLDSVTAYANTYVTEEYREEFLRFIQPENVKALLLEQRVIGFRYMVHRHERDSYEEVRFAGVRKPEDRDDHLIHAVGACFVNVDAEMRKSMAQSQTLKDALAAAEAANKAKTTFLSNMSHEIRTPMNAIIGLDNIALNDPEISDGTRDYLEKIRTSALHLLSIINDILDMSRIEAGRMTIKNEEFSFPVLLEQVNSIISGQCREKGLQYECRTTGQIDEHYIGDAMKLRQVMINILGNAVKFTPSGGTVTFCIEDVARLEDKATLRFVFRDTGIGMSEEFLPHLFDAFSQEGSATTGKFGSTGLGMPITKSIVELMNGNIEVESRKNAGTTFTVTVTLIRSADLEGDEQELHPNEMSVLVIDDDRVACEHAQIILGQIGINCEMATSGQEGIDMVKLRHARREDYDLLLVDWKMPGMDGVEVTRRIREIVGHSTPVIILTSYNWDDIIEEARAAGVDTFVAKPLFAGTVMDEFREAFRKKNEALAHSTVDLTGRRVLLAEDVPVNAEIMMMLLGMREMESDLAENGRIAVEKFSSHEPGYYDAVLMDMRMPEMDGLEATRAIRAMDRPDAKEIPIIALTANAFDEDVQRSMQAGLNAHLSKPVDPEVLFETLENLIRS